MPPSGADVLAALSHCSTLRPAEAGTPDFWLAVGVGIPALGIALHQNYESWAALVVAFVGAYAGALVGRLVRRSAA